jgi:hypothetical protein
MSLLVAIRAFLQGWPSAGRTQELREEMRAACMPR